MADVPLHAFRVPGNPSSCKLGTARDVCKDFVTFLFNEELSSINV